jgi:hypothetical protein
LAGIELATSTSYHPQTDGQIEIVNKWVEGYLRNYVGGQQCTWVRWLHMGEYCYNTTYHMSIKMSPFRALYGYDAPSFIDVAFRDSRVPGIRIGWRRVEGFCNQQRRTCSKLRINRRYMHIGTELSIVSR